MGLSLTQLGASHRARRRDFLLLLLLFSFSPPTLLGCLCQNHVSIAISKINHARPFFSSLFFSLPTLFIMGGWGGGTGGWAMAPLYGPGVGVWHGTGLDWMGRGGAGEIDSVLRSLSFSLSVST
jgi:hypothetical protein